MNKSEMQVHLLKTIDFSKAGRGCRMWLGDIDGDGRMEIVMSQPDRGFDDRYFPHSVTAITAFNLEGEVLWQYGTPDPLVSSSGADIPTQIYDIDGDGFNEVLCVMDDKFCIIDGKTGSLKKQHELPDQDAHDCIIIANLTGTDRPRDIILKNRYNKMWAFDNDFNLLWTFNGNIGHYPWVHDLNRDGFEEVIAGYTVLNHKGETLWTIDMTDHADCVWVGDIDQNYETGMNVLAGGDDTTCYTCDGKLLWRYTGTVESQNIALGNFRPEEKGTEVGGLDRIDRSLNGIDGMFLVTCEGKELYKEKRETRGWSTITSMIHNFDGKGSDNLLSYRRGGGMLPAIYDGFMNPVFTFEEDGHLMWADLIGDGKPQLISYNDCTLYIYSSDMTDLSKPTVNESRPQPKRLYNWTRYWGSELSPDHYALNYVTKVFSSNDVFAWAANPTEPTSGISRAEFAVLLVKALDLKAYVWDNFNDVKMYAYFYECVGILKKLGVVTGDSFNPDAPLTVADMADMAKKAGVKVDIANSSANATRKDVADLINTNIK